MAQGGVEFIEALPKSPSGKILRRLLRDTEREARRAKGSSYNHEAITKKAPSPKKPGVTRIDGLSFCLQRTERFALEVKAYSRIYSILESPGAGKGLLLAMFKPSSARFLHAAS